MILALFQSFFFFVYYILIIKKKNQLCIFIFTTGTKNNSQANQFSEKHRKRSIW